MDWELVRSCYHPDAIDRHGPFEGGGDDFIDWVADLLPNFETPTHFADNQLVNVVGDVAHAEHYKPFISPGQSVHLVHAGPMCVSDDDDTNLGSFMIVEADSIAQVQAFHEGDPFTLEGIFGRVDICRWDLHIG